MIPKLNRIAKAIAAFAVPASVFVADVAADVTTVSEDGFIDGTEWRLVLLGLATGLGTFLAPKNATAAG